MCDLMDAGWKSLDNLSGASNKSKVRTLVGDLAVNFQSGSGVHKMAVKDCGQNKDKMAVNAKGGVYMFIRNDGSIEVATKYRLKCNKCGTWVLQHVNKHGEWNTAKTEPPWFSKDMPNVNVNVNIRFGDIVRAISAVSAKPPVDKQAGPDPYEPSPPDARAPIASPFKLRRIDDPEHAEFEIMTTGEILNHAKTSGVRDEQIRCALIELIRKQRASSIEKAQDRCADAEILDMEIVTQSGKRKLKASPPPLSGSSSSHCKVPIVLFDLGLGDDDKSLVAGSSGLSHNRGMVKNSVERIANVAHAETTVSNSVDGIAYVIEDLLDEVSDSPDMKSALLEPMVKTKFSEPDEVGDGVAVGSHTSTSIDSSSGSHTGTSIDSSSGDALTDGGGGPVTNAPGENGQLLESEDSEANDDVSIVYELLKVKIEPQEEEQPNAIIAPAAEDAPPFPFLEVADEKDQEASLKQREADALYREQCENEAIRQLDLGPLEARDSEMMELIYSKGVEWLMDLSNRLLLLRYLRLKGRALKFYPSSKHFFSAEISLVSKVDNLTALTKWFDTRSCLLDAAMAEKPGRDGSMPAVFVDACPHQSLVLE